MYRLIRGQASHRGVMVQKHSATHTIRKAEAVTRAFGQARMPGRRVDRVIGRAGPVNGASSSMPR